MGNEFQILLYFTSAVILSTAIVVSWNSVRRLRATTAAYNARLLPFAYYSLLAWISMLISYMALGVLEARRIRSDVFSPIPVGPSLLTSSIENAVLILSTLGTTFLFLAAIALYSRRPHRPLVAVSVAMSLWLAAVSYLFLVPPLQRTLFWVVSLFLDALVFWIFIPAVLRLRLGSRYAAPFALYGALQIPWVVIEYRSGTWAIFMAGLVIARAALLLVWNRLIVLVLTRAERSHASAVAEIEALGRVPDLRRPFQVMISSTVNDLTQERDAADQAITEFHMSLFRAETFGSLPNTPRAYCEFMARSCDLLLLIIGERYGHIIEPEGISVVEFEYRIAKAADRRKILVYVKTVGRTDERLLRFLGELGDFEHGYLQGGFRTPEELYERIHIDIARWLTERACEHPAST